MARSRPPADPGMHARHRNPPAEVLIDEDGAIVLLRVPPIMIRGLREQAGGDARRMRLLVSLHLASMLASLGDQGGLDW